MRSAPKPNPVATAPSRVQRDRKGSTDMSDETIEAAAAAETGTAAEEQQAPQPTGTSPAPPEPSEANAGAQPDLTPEELIAALEDSLRDFKDGDIVEGEI